MAVNGGEPIEETPLRAPAMTWRSGSPADERLVKGPFAQGRGRQAFLFIFFFFFYGAGQHPVN